MTPRLKKKTKRPVERPGLDGQLELCSRHLGEGKRIMHTGTARLVEASEGMFLFVDDETGVEMWLHPDEVVSFTTGGAS